MLVIADDLTGAADCVSASAALGRRAAVLLHSPGDRQSDADWRDADILSIDADTRCLSAEQASLRTARLVQTFCASNPNSQHCVLFKKIDSTLRGHVAAELGALLQASRSANATNAKLSILLAPALPSQGRTTLGGRLLVHGVPLEKTDIWQAEPHRAQSDIPRLLAGADLSCRVVDLAAVRSGVTRLAEAILQLANQVDVILCDAETDDDLCAIAQASVRQPAITALAGSAGLASQIPQAIGIAPNSQPDEWKFATGPTLFVVGTAASASRQQARLLQATPDIATFQVSSALLHKPATLQTQIVQTLQAERDVLLMLDGEQCSQYDGQFLSRALSDLVSGCAGIIGALIATGGETARAILDAMGVHRLRLLGEVEAGLPFSATEGWARCLPVVTKAGAFGSPQALVRCREYLRNLKRVPGVAAKMPLHDES